MDRLEPGDVIWSACNGHKKRPWVVIWVNAEEYTCLLIAITSKSGFTGAVPTGARDRRYAYAAAWAIVWPIASVLRDANHGGYVFSEERARLLEANVLKSLGLQGNLS